MSDMTVIFPGEAGGEQTRGDGEMIRPTGVGEPTPAPCEGPNRGDYGYPPRGPAADHYLVLPAPTNTPAQCSLPCSGGSRILQGRRHA